MNGISIRKMSHMLTVARRCYDIAKYKYSASEEDARKCFLMGLIHDFGYEFSEETKEHPGIAAEILRALTVDDIVSITAAIEDHGELYQAEHCTIYDLVLNQADLEVDGIGNVVTVQERLDDIARRYGNGSREHNNAQQTAKFLEEKEK